MKPEIVIVDYGMGNLRSVEKAFESFGGRHGDQARVLVTSDPDKIKAAKKIVVPGVGAFAHAMAELKKRRLVDPIVGKIRDGAPFLGLCLGLQLLFEESEEGGRVKGFGVIPGRVKKFTASRKVPHMGWNEVRFKRRDCPIFRSIESESFFYFVHSYYAVPEDRGWVAGTTDYGREFCSAVWKDRTFATQFHPEKSQAIGLRIIRNFTRLAA